MATLKTIKENPPSSYLTKLAVVESGNNPNAKAKTSSASGAFQFLESTWKGLTNKYKLGYSLDDRFDPIKSKKVADLLTKENENVLRPVLGREPNDGERYLGHFLGTQGSKQLLSTYLKNPNEKVGNVVSGGALKANKSIFLNKDGSQKTVGDIYNWSAKKMSIKPTYVNTVAQDKNQTQETITPTLNYFDIPKETTTFASVPDSAEKEDTTEKIDKDVAEVEQKTKEYNFLEELQKEDYSHLQSQQIAQQQALPQVDFNQQYEQVSQFIDEPLVAQQGGSVKQDNDWIKNWYENRKIPQERIQELYEEDKPYYTERLKSIPPITKVKSINNNPNITGQYQEDTRKLLMTPNAQPSVYTHEVNHYLNQFPSAMRTVHNNIVEKNVAPKEKVKGIYNKMYNYFTNPDEIHSRIQVLRKEAKIKPDQKVTPEFLQKYLKTYKGENENINDLLNIADPPHLLEILNYMAEVPKSKEEQYIAQQGGKFSENELAFLSEIAIKDNNIIETKPSKIEGNGVFITKNLNEGDRIGLSHSHGQPSTTLGKFHNHSETPNAESIKIGDERFLKAIKKLKKGEEITVDYRKQPELEQPSDFKK